MSQHTCGKCGKVVSPLGASPTGPLARPGSTESFRCACGHAFTIASSGRVMFQLTLGGFLTLTGLAILGMGPGHPDLTVKGLVGFLIGAVTFGKGVRDRAVRQKNPEVEGSGAAK